ncbi:condensin complex subunit 1 [Orussus abietinus]|uniref:condensin complex subunit 1 n=1 Tax=Orussus abietinus TaxID=222816 RepID=UPI000626B623|nr:condensin complex subunit 1 [Orussus abietinus]
MTVLDFLIPLRKDELLESHCGQYTVKNLVPLHAVGEALDAARSAVQESGAKFILQHFDTFFSILLHDNKLKLPITIRAFDRIFKASELLIRDLEEAYSRETNLDHEERQELLCINKMLSYLLSSYTIYIEEHIQEDIVQNTFKKRKNTTKKSDIEEEWEIRREKIFHMIYRWLQIPLVKLWHPPIVEDSFIGTFSQMCYKILERSKDIKQKIVVNTVFEILGTLIKNYNYGISCSIRIVQLIKIYDTIAAPLGIGVMHMVSKCGNKLLLKEIMREIDQCEFQESEGRNLAVFLDTMATTEPKLIVSIIDDIMDHLQNECYSIRCGIISVLGTVITKALTDEDLERTDKQKRDECFNNIEEHLLDYNAHVRSKVLQILQNLCCERAIPLNRQKRLIHATTLRLEDKSANVRKQALQFLRAMLQINPLAAVLNQDEFSRKLSVNKEKLSEMQKKFITASSEGNDERSEFLREHLPEMQKAVKEVLNNQTENSPDKIENIDTDIAFEEVRRLLLSNQILKAVKYLCSIIENVPDVPSMDDLSNADKERNLLTFLYKIFMESESSQKNTPRSESEVQELKELNNQKLRVKYLEDCLEFSKAIDKAIPLIENLLYSGTSSVAIEACTFLGTACQFNVSNAEAGIRKALFQIYSSDQSVRDNLILVYKELYLEKKETNQSERQRVIIAVGSLIKLLKSLEPKETPALAQLMTAWHTNGDINSTVLQVMWEIYSMKLPGATTVDSQAAIMLVTMVARNNPEIITSNLETLINVGLGPRSLNDLYFVNDTCKALLKIKVDDATNSFKRLENNHEIIKRVTEILIDQFVNTKERGYVTFVTNSINVIYHLAVQPDVLIKYVLQKVVSQYESKEGRVVSASLTARLLHIVGHVAIRHLVFLDTVVYKALKRKNVNKQKRNSISGQPSSANVSLATLATSVSADLSLRNKEMSYIEDNGEEALGLGATVDIEAEQINHVLENTVVTGNGLLTKFVPFVLKVCRHPDIYKTEELQAAAALALSKMMTVSSTFCEQHLQLLITILQRSSYSGVRSNILIGLTDLTIRFPNQVEPWTSHIYGRLRDEDVGVRITCVKMLSNLILREMVRVRGQVAELALCIADPDPQIREETKMLFMNLSQKGNTLLNVLPDILSCLSSSELKLNEDNFQEIFKFILGLMQKDKQVDIIVEKLSTRFKLATTQRQWRDLSYCLSLLTFNAKSIKRLIHNLPFLKDKIHYTYVQKALKSIIDQNGKRKPETKEACLEMEEKIKEMLKETNDTDNNDADIMPPPPTPRLNTVKKKSKAKSRVSRNDVEDDDDDENLSGSDNIDADAVTSATRVSQRLKGNRNSRSSSSPALKKRRTITEQTPARTHRTLRSSSTKD